MATLDDTQKFWIETARTVLLGIAGTVAAFYILKPMEKGIDYESDLDKTRLMIVSGVVDDFLKASYHYTAIAYDACGGKETVKEHFQSDAIDLYRSAENRLAVYFDDVQAVKQEFNLVQNKTKQLGELCNKGAAKDQWEPVRKELKDANNRLAVAALKQMRLYRSSK